MFGAHNKKLVEKYIFKTFWKVLFVFVMICCSFEVMHVNCYNPNLGFSVVSDQPVSSVGAHSSPVPCTSQADFSGLHNNNIMMYLRVSINQVILMNKVDFYSVLTWSWFMGLPVCCRLFKPCLSHREDMFLINVLYEEDVVQRTGYKQQPGLKISRIVMTTAKPNKRLF